MKMVISNFNKDLMLGNKIAVHFKKARLECSEDIEITHSFVKINNDGLKYISLDNVKSIEFKDGVYKLQVIFDCVSIGKAINIDEQFLTIEIEDIKEENIYHNLITLSSILGIKSYN